MKPADVPSQLRGPPFSLLPPPGVGRRNGIDLMEYACCSRRLSFQKILVPRLLRHNSPSPTASTVRLLPSKLARLNPVDRGSTPTKLIYEHLYNKYLIARNPLFSSSGVRLSFPSISSLILPSFKELVAEVIFQDQWCCTEASITTFRTGVTGEVVHTQGRCRTWEVGVALLSPSLDAAPSSPIYTTISYLRGLGNAAIVPAREHQVTKALHRPVLHRAVEPVPDRQSRYEERCWDFQSRGRQ